MSSILRSLLPQPPAAAAMVACCRGTLSISILTFILLSLAFFALLYNERITSSSSTCSARSKRQLSKSSSSSSAHHHNEEETEEEKMMNKLEFDPDICDVTNGKWVYNNNNNKSVLYSDRTCPYVDRQFSCEKNGRPDSNYRYWEWQPNECTLPRFDPELALRKLKGKRLMFVGDSLIRNQWESFVCMVEFIIPKSQKSMRRDKIHSVFTVKEYNATIEFYWAPFLIESNSDTKMILDPKKRYLKIDSVAKHAVHWRDVDVLVFGSYVWWLSSVKVNAYWGSFANGEDGSDEIEMQTAYRIGLKTWANWVDSTIDSNKTQVFFTTMSPTHTRSLDWRKDGIKCFNETRPLKKKGHWGTGSDKKMMKAATDVINKMRVSVNVINVTQISEYRVDGHSSIYTETGGKLLTEEQKKDPLRNADCIHWCLPGVPDTWNQILFAHFLLYL